MVEDSLTPSALRDLHTCAIRYLSRRQKCVDNLAISCATPGTSIDFFKLHWVTINCSSRGHSHSHTEQRPAPIAKAIYAKHEEPARMNRFDRSESNGATKIGQVHRRSGFFIGG